MIIIVDGFIFGKLCIVVDGLKLIFLKFLFIKFSWDFVEDRGGRKGGERRGDNSVLVVI